MCSRGSSPRGRGKRKPGEYLRMKDGLIPAWAGKTSRWSLSRPCRAAHPRVGGENPSRRSWLVRPGGSSPRGRGKLQHRRVGHNDGGLIPAWAGKTLIPYLLLPPSSGSSPRGRGKPAYLPGRLKGGRLIPAWAGKTRRPPGCGRTHEAHPRVGGENAYSARLFSNSAGSSPRGRGKLHPAFPCR